MEYSNPLQYDAESAFQLYCNSKQLLEFENLIDALNSIDLLISSFQLDNILTSLSWNHRNYFHLVDFQKLVYKVMEELPETSEGVALFQMIDQDKDELISLEELRNQMQKIPIGKESIKKIEVTDSELFDMIRLAKSTQFNGLLEENNSQNYKNDKVNISEFCRLLNFLDGKD